MYRERIEPAAAPVTIVEYLAGRYPHTPADAWQQRIQQGQVLVNGRPVHPNETACAGAERMWRRPPWTEPSAPLSFDVVHEDEHLLVVSKPPGLPTLPGGGFLENTLLSIVRKSDPAAVPVHRLGRWTSGLVVFARTPEARKKLAAAWRECEVTKIYRTVAEGRPIRETFTIDTPIGERPYAPLGMLHMAAPEGRESETRVTVLAGQDDTFLADVCPKTGRPHQIRIHLASAGHPLVGDPLYGVGGVPPDGSSALPGDPGYTLHAHTLEFEHPGRKSLCSFRSPVPPWLVDH